MPVLMVMAMRNAELAFPKNDKLGSLKISSADTTAPSIPSTYLTMPTVRNRRTNELKIKTCPRIHPKSEAKLGSKGKKVLVGVENSINVHFSDTSN